MVNQASVGDEIDQATANAAPILNTNAPSLGPTLNWEPIEGLPPELQPTPGDILLSKLLWPWEDLGAQGIPEHWLYMSRHVQGTIAMLAVQTPNGPRLVKANADGTLSNAPVVLGPTYGQAADNQSVDVVLAGGATSTILSLTPSQGQLILMTSTLELESAVAANSWSLRGSISGKTLAHFSTALAGPRNIDFGRRMLDGGDNLDVHNIGAVAIAIKGTIAYTYTGFTTAQN